MRMRVEPILIVLIVVAVGLVLIWAHHPRKGLALVATAFAGAGLGRLLLSPRSAGLLVVRSRALDVALLLVVAAAIAALAVIQVFPSSGG
jgi:Protein of unknown function (DUF3017)